MEMNGDPPIDEVDDFFDDILLSLKKDKAENQLDLLQQSNNDFAALTDAFGNALSTQEFCEEPNNIFAFFDLLKIFLHRQGYWVDAAESAKRAVEAAQALGNTKKEAEAVFQQGLIVDETAVSDEAEPYFQKALELAQQVGAWSIEADIEHRRGWIAQMAGEGGTAVSHYTKALNLHEEHNDSLGQVREYQHLAKLSLDNGELKKANQYLETAYTLLPQLPNDREVNRLRAGFFAEFGRLASREENVELAQTHYETALDYAKQAEDESIRQNVLFLHIQLLEKTKKYVDAEQGYKQYLEQAIKMGNKRAQVASNIALGTLNLNRKDYAKARDYYDEALSFASLREKAIIDYQLGQIAFLEGNYQLAVDHYQNAFSVFKEINAKKEVANSHHQLGIVAQYQYLWGDALFHFEESLKIRRELELEQDIVRSLYQLGSFFEQKGQKDKACQYYVEAYQLGKPLEFSLIGMIQERLGVLGCAY